MFKSKLKKLLQIWFTWQASKTSIVEETRKNTS